MKRTSAPKHDGAQETLFETRLRDFARAVALRHGRGRVDRAGFEVALRGYYAALSLFATSPIPPLDDAAQSFALVTYLETVSHRSALAA